MSLTVTGCDPFNQNFRKFRSKTQWIGSVQPEKFRNNGTPFEVDHFSRLDRLEFWLNGSRPLTEFITVSVSLGNSMICSDIWHKYHDCYT